MLTKPALLQFKFRHFADLPSEVDSKVYSEDQTDCNGNKWYLMLCPGGQSTTTEKSWVGLYLFPQKNKESLEAVYRLAVRDANRAIAQEIQYDSVFQSPGEERGRGSPYFMKRDVILDPNNNILKDGALYIDVTIQVKDKKDDHYDPENKLSQKMMKLLESGERADASFKVGDSIFPVHSLILHSNAPILAHHLDQEETSNVIIKGRSAAVFQMVLKFVYAEHRPTDLEVFEHGKELIDAANRYELVDLKMIVEHVLVRERILTTKNVCDYILFANAKSCPLLQEYAITFLRLNAKEVLKSEYSKCLKEASELYEDIFILFAEGNEETLTVNELRKELGKRKLDVDGSKEALVLRLEEAKRQRTE